MKKFIITEQEKGDIKNMYSIETPRYFYNIKYTVPTNWYNDTREVINTTLHFSNDEMINKTPKYKIKYDGEDNGNEVYLIKVYSNVDKVTLNKYLDGQSTRVENYEIL